MNNKTIQQELYKKIIPIIDQHVKQFLEEMYCFKQLNALINEPDLLSTTQGLELKNNLQSMIDYAWRKYDMKNTENQRQLYNAISDALRNYKRSLHSSS